MTPTTPTLDFIARHRPWSNIAGFVLFFGVLALAWWQNKNS